MQALKNSVNDLQTSFGQLLLPALAAILPLFQSLADLAQRHSTIFAGLSSHSPLSLVPFFCMPPI
jgi:hypothetical protein